LTDGRGLLLLSYIYVVLWTCVI